MLSDLDIIRELNSNNLKITPTEESMIQPSSIDFLLGSQFRIMKEESESITVNPLDDNSKLFDLIDLSDSTDGFVLKSGQFALAVSYEYFNIPNNLVGFAAGKSSLARVGLQIECAGLIDPGWEGEITLELVNLSKFDLLLTPGMKIGQVYFNYLTSSVIRPYGTPGLGSHYQGQRGPTAAKSTLT